MAEESKDEVVNSALLDEKNEEIESLKSELKKEKDRIHNLQKQIADLNE